MLTITDFINILHRYYKSPMVSGMDLAVCECGQDGMVFPVFVTHRKFSIRLPAQINSELSRTSLF